MSLNTQTSKAFINVARKTGQSLTRSSHAHPAKCPLFIPSPVQSLFHPPTSRSLRVSPSSHIRHCHRYFSSADAAVLNSQSQPPLYETRDIRRHSETSRRVAERNGEKNHYTVARSSPKSYQNREPSPQTSSLTDVPGAGTRRKTNRNQLELKDLAVPKKQKKQEPWQEQKQALKEKFGEAGWNPRKKLSPDTMEGIRALHDQDPDKYSTPVLAEHFAVSAEAVRRILKSKWRPTEKEMDKRRERWAKRHDRIWDQQAELGLRPMRTKDKQVEEPDEFEENLRAKEILDNARNA